LSAFELTLGYVGRCGGNGKNCYGIKNKYWYPSNPSQLWFTITGAVKIDSTKIRHKCGNCATIFQSGPLAELHDLPVHHLPRYFMRRLKMRAHS
jgi:hypothetical protein